MNDTKTITIRAKTKIVEPKLYTIIFLINEKYYNFQKIAYSLEDAVQKCTLSATFNFRTPKTSEIWWNFEMTITEMKQQLKNLN